MSSDSREGAEAPNPISDVIDQWAGNNGRFVLIIPTGHLREEQPRVFRPLFLLKLLDPDGNGIVWHGFTMVEALKAAFEWQAEGYFPLVPYCSGHEVNEAMAALEPSFPAPAGSA